MEKNLHKLLPFIIILTVSTLILTCCNSIKPTSTTATAPSTTSTITAITTTEAADDLVETPDGFAYRANVNPPNQWPEIKFVGASFGIGSSAINVMYRDYIETVAGQTRNDIFWINGTTQYNVVFTVTNLPDGITTVNDDASCIYTTWQGPNDWEGVVEFKIASGIQPGNYNFNVDVQINGQDYGIVPCIIKVLAN